MRCTQALVQTTKRTRKMSRQARNVACHASLELLEQPAVKKVLRQASGQQLEQGAPQHASTVAARHRPPLVNRTATFNNTHYRQLFHYSIRPFPQCLKLEERQGRCAQTSSRTVA